MHCMITATICIVIVWVAMLVKKKVFGIVYVALGLSKLPIWFLNGYFASHTNDIAYDSKCTINNKICTYKYWAWMVYAIQFL